MQFFRLLLALAAGAQAAKVLKHASELEVDTHPIANVIAKMEELAKQSVAEAKTEEKTYATFVHWCEKTDKKLNKAIVEEKDVIKETTAEIKAKKMELRVLDEEIEALTISLDKMNAAAATNAENRADEVATYKSNKADLESTISAVKEALTALLDTQGSADFIQTDAKVVSQAEAQVARKLLQMPLVLMSLSDDQEALLEYSAGESPLSGAAPKKKEYTFKTGGVTDLLKGLRNDFEDKLHETELDEKKNSMNYDLTKGASDNSIKVATETKTAKKKVEGETKAAKTDLENLLSNTESDLKADSESLSTTTATCKLRANEMTQRRYQREREQEAIAYGVKILAKATGVRSAAPAPPPSFIQLRSQSGAEEKIEVVQDLRKEAEQMHSNELDMLAMKVEAHMADFGKSMPIGKEVDQIIEKQTFKLKDEQKKDDEKKIWCDTEVAKANKDKDHKVAHMNDLTNEIKSATSTVTTYTKKIEELKDKITDLDKDTHEEKMDRQETSNENNLAIKDAQDAQKSLADAIKVLEKFYKDAAEAAESTALLQAPAEVAKAPDTWDKPGFTGTGQDGKGPGAVIIGLLETTEADFAKMEAETKANDAADKKAFEKKMQENKVAKAKAVTEVENKEEENSQLQEQIESWTNEFKQTDRAKHLLEVKLEDLGKECIEKKFKDRKDARAMEMDGLKQAQEKLKKAFDHQNEAAALAAASAKAVTTVKPVQAAPVTVAPVPVQAVQQEALPVQPVQQPVQKPVQVQQPVQQPVQPAAAIQTAAAPAESKTAPLSSQKLPYASFLSP